MPSTSGKNNADAGHPPEFRVWVTVLAAGAGRRLGRNKPLAKVSGQSLLARAINTARRVVGDRVLVVAGHEASRLLPELAALQCGCVVNPDWQEGMGRSIAVGVRALPPSASHAIVLPVDLPAVSAEQLQSLASLADSHDTVACAEYSGTTGPPVLFPRNAFSRLVCLSGDAGAKSVAQDWHPRVVVPMASAALDIDTPADLASAERATELGQPG